MAGWLSRALVAALLLLAAAGPARAADGFRLTPAEAAAKAAASEDGKRLTATGLEAGMPTRPAPGLWRVPWTGPDGAIRGTVLVEDRTGEAMEDTPWAWPPTGDRPVTTFEARVELAMLLLTAVFLAGLVDWRNVFRLVHVDLLALVALGLSLALYDRGEPLWSVPLVYPPLLWLAARMLARGLGGARDALRPRAPTAALVAGIALLAVARVAFGLSWGEVTDVGYASLFGADGIVHGFPLYTDDRNHLDTYGPLTYAAYIPFEALFPLEQGVGRGNLDGARVAALAFDLLTALALFALGRRRTARTGIVLAFAWLASPFSFFTLASATNDPLVALLVALVLLAAASLPIRSVLVAFAGAAKFGPLVMAPLVARGPGPPRLAATVAGLAVAAGVTAVLFGAFIPADGAGAVWEATLGFQLERRSFLSIWGQYPELAPLQLAIQAGTIALAAAVAVVGRRGLGVERLAALGAALVIALELGMQHWFYFYVVWFLPLVLVAIAGVEEDGAQEGLRTA